MKELFSRAGLKKLLRAALYLFLTLLLQDMVLSQIRPLGVCAFVLPAAVVAVGMFEGATVGVIFALVMGIFADMSFIESSVGFTLLFPLLSFAASFISQFFLNRRFFAWLMLSAGALLVTALMQLLRAAAGDGFSGVMLSTVVLQTLWSLPPALLLYPAPARHFE